MNSSNSFIISARTYFLRCTTALSVAIEHIVEVVIASAGWLICYICVILRYRLVRGQDLSLLCLTCAHDLATHKHLTLSVSRAWLTLVLLFLSFEDHLLLLKAQVTSVG